MCSDYEESRHACRHTSMKRDMAVRGREAGGSLIKKHRQGKYFFSGGGFHMPMYRGRGNSGNP